MFKKITFLLLVLSFISCKKSGINDPENNEKDKIKASHWLLGTWENKSTDGNLKEIWTKANDSTYGGQSYFIKGNDTIHFETIQLQQLEEELTYSATIKGQNNDKAVSFQLTNATENEMVFENLKHDYPQKITYSQLSPDSLLVKISGMDKGKLSEEQYAMKKTK